ncbi:MAG: hypothetical protein SOT36_09215 [Hominisplanchenecus sp.]|nr:hypothetical protein [Lachnospiraceae bacterium]MDY2820337.1 hypothetical protein [Hominisplanchenecus sp.]
MDKYEYNLKLEEITRLVEQENYEDAVDIADTIDWRRVRNVRTLCMVSEIYEANGRLEDSRDILLRAYRKSQAVRSILFRLTEISIKLREFDDAADYYSEFVSAAPHDNSRYLLKYMIYKGRGASLEDQIEILEEYNQKEYTEKYAYEIAKLYYRAGNMEKCVDACDDLVLWFRQGKYVIRALELKQKITELTPVQQAIYDNRNEATMPKAEMVEAVAPDLEKVLMENVPDTTKEVITDDVISVTEKEIAQSVAEHTAAGTREEEADAEPVYGDQETPAQTQAKPRKDYGFNTADLQVELAKSMRDIVAGIQRKPDDSDIIEPVNNIAEPVSDAGAEDGAAEEILEQNPIDDILMSMSSAKQEEAVSAQEAELPEKEASVQEAEETAEESAKEAQDQENAVQVAAEEAQAVKISETEAAELAKTKNIAEAIASEPAPEPEKIPTDLTDEQRYTFSYFSTIGGLKEQIAGALYTVMKKMNTMDQTSRTGNMIILGAEGSGKSTLGIRFAQSISREKGETSAKVAKIYAEDFNKKDIPSTVARIAGGTLIIEEAGDLEDAVVEQLSKAMEFRTDALLVILEDEKKYLKELFDRHPDFAEKFTAQIIIPVFTNDELVAFGRTYAYDADYKIDEGATAALYERIGEIQASGQPVTVIDVKEIIDAAIKKSEKIGFRKLGMVLSHKRYDEEDRVILYEKDFR